MLSSWLGAHKCHTWIDSQDTRIVASSCLVGRHQFSLCGIWPAGDTHPFLLSMPVWKDPNVFMGDTRVPNSMPDLMGYFFGSWYPLISYWLVCIHNQLFLLASCAFLEVMLEYEWLANLFWFNEAKLKWNYSNMSLTLEGCSMLIKVCLLVYLADVQTDGPKVRELYIEEPLSISL